MSRPASFQTIVRRFLLACVCLLPLAGALATPPPVQAASYTFKVNSNEWFADVDPGDGICKTGENNCTLRAAAQEAHALGVSSGGADTITINLERNTYPLQGTLNPGNATVIINGNGSTLTGAFMGSTADYRLFMSSSFTGEWLFSDLTLRDSTGGGIYALGTGRLSVINCVLTSLRATTTTGSTDGGAIATGNMVSLTVMSSQFDTNTADGNGGAISHGHGPLFISNSTFAGNIAARQGGGLYAVSSAGSTFALNNVNFRGNTAASGGGLYVSSSILQMTGGEVSGNTALGDGGGIALSYIKAGTLLDQVRITGNVAYQEGGGLLLDKDTFDARLLKSTVSGNTAWRGGGVAVHGGRVDVEQTAVVDNRAIGTATTDGGAGIRVTAGGGIVSPVLSVINSTLSGNVAHRHGGGLYVGAGAAAYLSSATLTENVANEAGSTGAGGGIWNAGTASLANTIVAGNLLRPPSGGGQQLQTSDVAGDLVSRGYNLLGIRIPVTSITGDTTGNLVGSATAPRDAGLGARTAGCSFDLLDSVPAHLLLANSVAINAGNPAGARHVRPNQDRALTVDQCGLPRAQQGRADMGASESPYDKPAPVLPYTVYLPLVTR
ncbi:MAG: right-handed parallel beta-helix repeat-containing protein [Anaerolineae bacterium]